MATVSHREITARAYRFDPDFQRVRDLLLRTYASTPTGFNWDIRRWDGWHFHRAEQPSSSTFVRQVRLWERADGKIIGTAHPEGAGELFLEIDPDYRNLEDEMLAWGEHHLAADHQITTFAFEYDVFRQRLLQKRGYTQTPYGSVSRRLRLGKRDLPAPEMPQGYAMTVTHHGDYDDCARMAALLNAAFNRSIHSSGEYVNFVANSPSFRHDLNLIAVASDGSFAAHVGVTYDEVNRRCIFEPVCTHPDHQRKGLARALMLEGLRRARVLGVVDAYVDTGDGMAANFLYEQVGFTEVYHGFIWRKVL